MPTFDIVSRLESAEVDNAVHQAQREVAQRFDFKNTGTSFERTAEGIVIRSESEGRVGAALDVLRDKLVRRKISLKVLDPKTPEPAGGKTWRQLVALKEGVSTELARTLVQEVKAAKLKVQASIQGDLVRVSGKKRDDLQAIIAHLKEPDRDRPLQFVNFRD